MNMNLQREAFEAFVRSGASPVPPSEVDNPLADGSYRTSAANAGWVFWQAAHLPVNMHADAAGLDRCKDPLPQKVLIMVDENSAWPTSALATALNAQPMREAQMHERIKILSDEMDANDEENRDMQVEIDALYAKIDAAQSATA